MDISETTQPAEPYSAFTVSEKRVILFLAAFAAMFSPLSSFIYYPATSAIAKGLNTSISNVNLGITTYMIVSGIIPAVVGDMADHVGRRPVYIVTFTIYLGANLGLACQRTLPSLLVLRMIQSAGSSGTIAIAYAVVSDIATPAERGSFVGILLLGPNLAPLLGPILGGVLVQLAGWPYVFWFLAIASGVALISLLCFLPETARNIVGSGIRPVGRLSKSLLSILKESEQKSNSPKPTTDLRPKRKMRVPNPLASLFVLLEKDTAVIIAVNGLFYMTYCCVQTSLSALTIELYGYGELKAGLLYLPFGFGCLIGSYAFGKLMDYDYRKTAEAVDVAIGEIAGDNRIGFPIEKARFRSIWWLLLISSGSILGYGWSLHVRTVSRTSSREIYTNLLEHVVVPLVLQFLIGSTVTGIFNMCGTLLIDLHPRQPATVQASLNIIRCALAAGGVAALQPVIDAIGSGWCFTIFAMVTTMSAPLCWAEMKWGAQWRSGRDLRAPVGDAR